MAKRYYLDKLVPNAANPSKPPRPSIIESGLLIEGDSTQIVTGDTANVGDDCLLIVSTRNHAALASLPNVVMLPDYPLDAKVNAMHQATKVAMRNRLSARGVAESVMDNADGFRDIIEHIARVKLGNTEFSADNFDA